MNALRTLSVSCPSRIYLGAVRLFEEKKKEIQIFQAKRIFAEMKSNALELLNSPKFLRSQVGGEERGSMKRIRKK